MANRVGHFLRESSANAATAWVPDAWWGWGLGAVGGYLGKELAIKHTPQLINRILKNSIAPTVARQNMIINVTPVSSSFGAFAGLYLTVVTANIMLKIFKHLHSKDMSRTS